MRSGIVLLGYYGFGNVGDELILLSLLTDIRQSQPSTTVTVLSAQPERTRRWTGAHAVHRFKPWQWLALFLRSERFCLGGGGLLQESTGPWNHLYYLSIAAMAKLLGCRTEAVAQGVDPVRSAFNRWLTRWIIMGFIDEISVRDEASQKALQACGVTKRIQVVDDPVYRLPVVPRNRAAAPGPIALILSPLLSVPHWRREAANLADRLRLRFQLPVELLAFFPAEDAAFCMAVSRKAWGQPSVRQTENPTHFLEQISTYQVVVSTRFHGLVLAARAGLPFVGLGPQPKVASWCRRFSMPYFSLERYPGTETIVEETYHAAHAFHPSTVPFS